MFEFKLQTNTAFGPNSLQALAPFMKKKGYRRIGVIIDANVSNTSYWQEVKQGLQECGSVDPYFENRTMEPTYDFLDEIRGRFDPGLDCLVGVGGGSTMDTAKAVSVLVTNTGAAIEYRGFELVKNRGIPLILIPSTAGSGSEVTPFAVFTDAKARRKFGINSPLYTPVLTVVDPMLMMSCPRSVTVASGMDALTHTLEAYTARKSTPMAKLFAEKAFSLVYNTLPKVVADPANIELRTDLSLGAYCAGIALLNSSGSTAGVMSYPIGTLFNVTHGMAGAVFVRPVVEFNVRNGYEGYANLYDLMDPGSRASDTGSDKSKLFAEHLGRFCDTLGIPRNLGAFGVHRSDVPTIMEHLKPLWGAIEQNPVPMAEKDIEDILSGMLA